MVCTEPASGVCPTETKDLAAIANPYRTVVECTLTNLATLPFSTAICIELGGVISLRKLDYACGNCWITFVIGMRTAFADSAKLAACTAGVSTDACTGYLSALLTTFATCSGITLNTASHKCSVADLVTLRASSVSAVPFYLAAIAQDSELEAAEAARRYARSISTTLTCEPCFALLGAAIYNRKDLFRACDSRPFGRSCSSTLAQYGMPLPMFEACAGFALTLPSPYTFSPSEWNATAVEDTFVPQHVTVNATQVMSMLANSSAAAKEYAGAYCLDRMYKAIHELSALEAPYCADDMRTVGCLRVLGDALVVFKDCSGHELLSLTELAAAVDASGVDIIHVASAVAVLLVALHL